MGGVPSVPRDKTPQLQVIAAGYSRTGTSSVSLALEQLLQGPVFHGGNQLFQREDGNYSHFLHRNCGSKRITCT